MISLAQFAEDFFQNIQADSAVEDNADFAENVFTRFYCNDLCEAGEIAEAETCFYLGTGKGVRGSNIKVNAYAADYENDRLDLVVTHFTGSSDPVRLEKKRVDDAFKTLRAFAVAALDGLKTKMEESGPAFELAQILSELQKKDAPIGRLRLIFLTNGRVESAIPKAENIGSLEISHVARDIDWLYKTHTSGHTFEAIEIDFAARQGAIACLPMPSGNDEYQSYLLLLSGQTLYDIYAEFGPRLLERNVRSFLQAKGGVNRGIRETLVSEPHRFLAYNNGLTATAQSVSMGASGTHLERVTDFQIVNGGQTTASIFHAKRYAKADISDVWVQVKLSVVSNPDELDEFVSNIAKFANSQNKINVADFSANSPFHRAMQDFSRAIWAPAQSGASNQTRWFYERARGQYADASNSAGTPTQVKSWQNQHPKNQMFTKTDLAKFENVWMQKPHTVSKGAQTNFAEFTTGLAERKEFVPNERYFQHLVAKAIWFRRAEKIVSDQKFGGYRANIVAYTLAYIAFKSAQRIDLDAIWKKQDISEALEKAVEQICHHVHEYITTASNGANVTQFCKQEKCWKGIKEEDWELPADLTVEFIALGPGTGYVATTGDSLGAPSQSDLDVILQVDSISGEAWKAVSNWAKNTGNLQTWQRSILYSIGRRRSSGESISVKQATQGLKALAEARELGWSDQ